MNYAGPKSYSDLCGKRGAGQQSKTHGGADDRSVDTARGRSNYQGSSNLMSHNSQTYTGSLPMVPTVRKTILPNAFAHRQ
jgi:hypothetical protein